MKKTSQLIIMLSLFVSQTTFAQARSQDDNVFCDLSSKKSTSTFNVTYTGFADQLNIRVVSPDYPDPLALVSSGGYSKKPVTQDELKKDYVLLSILKQMNIDPKSVAAGATFDFNVNNMSVSILKFLDKDNRQLGALASIGQAGIEGSSVPMPCKK